MQQSRGAQTLELGGPGSDLAVKILRILPSSSAPLLGHRMRCFPLCQSYPIPSKGLKEGSCGPAATGSTGINCLCPLPQATDADPTLVPHTIQAALSMQGWAPNVMPPLCSDQHRAQWGVTSLICHTLPLLIQPGSSHPHQMLLVRA